MTAARRAEIAFGLRSGIVSCILYGYAIKLFHLIHGIIV